jgi:hypothetical protein
MIKYEPGTTSGTVKLTEPVWAGKFDARVAT